MPRPKTVVDICEDLIDKAILDSDWLTCHALQDIVDAALKNENAVFAAALKNLTMRLVATEGISV